VNQTDGTFADQADEAAIRLTPPATAPLFLDGDNDGDVDLFLAAVGYQRNIFVFLTAPKNIGPAFATSLTANTIPQLIEQRIRRSESQHCRKILRTSSLIITANLTILTIANLAQFDTRLTKNSAQYQYDMTRITVVTPVKVRLAHLTRCAIGIASSLKGTYSIVSWK